MSNTIRKGVEVIYNGRAALVTRTTTLNMHGRMADLVYADNGDIGCALVADLVRADDVALPAAPAPAAGEYQANELVDYVGPTGIGPWVHGPVQFLGMVGPDTAEILTMSGTVHVAITDLRRSAR